MLCTPQRARLVALGGNGLVEVLLALCGISLVALFVELGRRGPRVGSIAPVVALALDLGARARGGAVTSALARGGCRSPGAASPGSDVGVSARVDSGSGCGLRARSRLLARVRQNVRR